MQRIQHGFTSVQNGSPAVTSCTPDGASAAVLNIFRTLRIQHGFTSVPKASPTPQAQHLLERLKPYGTSSKRCAFSTTLPPYKTYHLQTTSCTPVGATAVVLNLLQTLRIRHGFTSVPNASPTDRRLKPCWSVCSRAEYAPHAAHSARLYLRAKRITHRPKA